MNDIIPLYNLSCYGVGIVECLDNNSLLYDRFKELGIIEGAEIKKIMTSPLGDPSAYLVKGTLIAIRRSDASGIFVREVQYNAGK